MREHASWDPTAYGRYAGERSRPFADLVAQVRADDPQLVEEMQSIARQHPMGRW